jgi:hypothetical protein
MVKGIQGKEGDLFQCEVCGLKYASREMGEKCEAWCTEHKSCNLDIIKDAVLEDTTATV